MDCFEVGASTDYLGPVVANQPPIAVDLVRAPARTEPKVARWSGTSSTIVRAPGKPPNVSAFRVERPFGAHETWPRPQYRPRKPRNSPSPTRRWDDHIFAAYTLSLSPKKSAWTCNPPLPRLRIHGLRWCDKIRAESENRQKQVQSVKIRHSFMLKSIFSRGWGGRGWRCWRS